MNMPIDMTVLYTSMFRTCSASFVQVLSQGCSEQKWVHTERGHLSPVASCLEGCVSRKEIRRSSRQLELQLHLGTIKCMPELGISSSCLQGTKGAITGLFWWFCGRFRNYKECLFFSRWFLSRFMDHHPQRLKWLIAVCVLDNGSNKMLSILFSGIDTKSANMETYFRSNAKFWVMIIICWQGWELYKEKRKTVSEARVSLASWLT